MELFFGSCFLTPNFWCLFLENYFRLVFLEPNFWGPTFGSLFSGAHFPFFQNFTGSVWSTGLVEWILKVFFWLGFTKTIHSLFKIQQRFHFVLDHTCKSLFSSHCWRLTIFVLCWSNLGYYINIFGLMLSKCLMLSFFFGLMSSKCLMLSFFWNLWK